MLSRRYITAMGALVALSLLTATTASAQLVPNFDHLKCYKVKDFAQKKVYKVDMLPEQRPPFNLETGCKLIVPAKLFCIDVIKFNVQPQPPGAPAGQKAADYLCYKVACPKQTLPMLVITDQFGARDVQIKPPKYLCAPATKQIIHQTPVPTRTPTPVQPTPTPTIQPTAHCDFLAATGKCGGPCPPMEQCVWVVNSNGTAGCDCRPPDPSCTLPAGANQCTGPCPDPRDQCRNGLPGEPPCTCSHPCSKDPTVTPPQCNGDCPNPTDTCVTDAVGNCNCHPPTAPPCGNTTAPQCDGACPTSPGGAQQACVPQGPAGSPCFCETGTPPPCGQLQGNPQCLGACPPNTACVAVGPVPGGSCACQ